MNLLSVGAAYGVLVAVFQWGWLDWTGYDSPGYVETIVPALVLAVTFGLSMDYEVFLLTRIRERWLEHGDNERAVAEGLTLSARIITSAALVMVAVFFAFVVAGAPVAEGARHRPRRRDPPRRDDRPAPDRARRDAAARASGTGGCLAVWPACSRLLRTNLAAMRILVSGGAGFIGSHFVKRPPAPARTSSSSTSSRTAATARTCRIDVEFHDGDIADAGRRRAGCARLRSDRQLRRRDARRPLDPHRRGLRPHGVPRHAGAARAHPRAGIRLVQVSTDEVYGDLEAGGSSKETDPLRPSSPYSAAKAAGELLNPGVRAHVRRQRVDHARLEHLRAEPVSGEVHPALRHERARRRAAAALRRRQAGARLALRRGPLRRRSSSCCARARPARSTTSAAATSVENIDGRRADRRADRRRPLAAPPRRRPPGPRPPLLARHGEARAGSAGRRRRAFETGLAETVSWYRDHRDWWEQIKSGEYREYYERQYADRLANATSA